MSGPSPRASPIDSLLFSRPDPSIHCPFCSIPHRSRIPQYRFRAHMLTSHLGSRPTAASVPVLYRTTVRRPLSVALGSRKSISSTTASIFSRRHDWPSQAVIVLVDDALSAEKTTGSIFALLSARLKSLHINVATLWVRGLLGPWRPGGSGMQNSMLIPIPLCPKCPAPGAACP